MYNRLLSGLLLFIPFCLKAQEQAVVVKGRLIDKQTKEALPYSAIYLPSRKTGTVANGEGRFAFHVSQPTSADSVVLSSVGYVSARLPLAKLLNQPDEQAIALQPSVQQLTELVVRPVDPVELVQESMRRVARNYPLAPSLLTGFYREWVREKDFIVLSEGQLELYKTGYKKHTFDDAVRMVKGRRKPLPDYFLSGGDTCHLPDITNGPHLGIMLDVVKNPGLSNFLEAVGPDLYEYTYAGQTSVNDRSAYIIEFTPKYTPAVAIKGGINSAIFTGKLLIDTQSQAVVNADYTLSLNGLRMVNRSLELLRLPIRLDNRRYVVSYQRLDDRYVLHHAQVENSYTYKLRPAQPIRSRMDFVVTQTSFSNVQRPNKKDSIKADQSFSERVMTFDDTFWANDNIIVDEQ